METYNIDNVKIPFDKNWKKISISLSGGADSALLTHMLCDIIKDTKSETEIHIISHIRMWKTRPWQSYDSLRVYNYFVEKFPTFKFYRHSGFIAPDLEWGNKGPYMYDEYNKWVSGDNIQLRAYSEYICFQNNIEAYYNAVTRNPRNTNFEGMSTRNVEINETNKHLEFMIHMGKIVSHPFRFIEKNWIVSQYRKRNLMELFDITRSCEGEFLNIDFTNYKSGMEVPLCNECFWCKERKWAIEQSK